MKNRSNRNIFTTFITVIFLTGCSLTPDYERPTVNTPAWKGGEVSQNVEIAADWWKGYGSNELNTLIEQALAHNNDLQASLHRIEQARAGLQIAGASLLPSASVTTSFMNGPKQAFNITDRRNKGVPEFTGDAGISYELDLFGANRAEVEESEANLLGTQYAHEALALIVMGDVAQGYFNVVNLRELRRIASDNVKIVEDLLKVVEARFQNGSVTALDIAQQETVLSNTKAELAAVEQKLALAENALAVILGQPPQTIDVSGRNLNNITLPPLVVVQPAELLERRPDIRKAEADLIAANADIGAARAAFYPSLNLGSNLLLAANPSASALLLVSSLSAPIFQGGRLEGGLKRTKERQAELVENYKKAVLVSFQETEDALTKVKTTQTRQDALRQAVTKSRKAYEIARSQYQLSVVDFQTVLNAQRLMLQAEDNHARARFDTLSNSIDLFKSMGGGWNVNETQSVKNEGD
ncbi:MAG: RND transporter [Micavibrio sp.]|nr:MAG: RND transporter [Micavibrio sp.]